MGSSRSKLTERSPSDIVLCSSYKWTSEFGDECTIVFRTEGTQPGICVNHYSQSHEKVIYTFYDAFCGDNFVAVNIEFVAVRDGDDGSYKFGPIKAIEYGENFTVRRRRPIGSDLLFLRYIMGRRTNQLALHRRGEEYEIVFDSDQSPLKPFYCSVRISCHPSGGLLMDFPTLSGFSSFYIDGRDKPPNDVMKEASDIRRQLMEDAVTGTSQGNNTGPSLSNSQNYVISNTGQTQGLLNGSNFRHCQIHIEGSRFQFKGHQNP